MSQRRGSPWRKPGSPGGAGGAEDDRQRGPASEPGFKLQSICKDPKCQALIEEHPKTHRHTTAECMHHVFCQASTMPALEDKFQHKTVTGLPNELADAAWFPKTASPAASPFVRGGMAGGEARNVDTVPLEGALQLSTQFSKTLKEAAEPFKMVPAGRKVVMTDQVIDTWLAAHYGIDTDHIPRKQPSTVPKHLFDRFKKLRALSHTTVHGSRNKRALNSGHANIEKQGRSQPKKGDAKNNTQSSHDNSHQYRYRTAPDDFKLISYPRTMAVQSIADKAIQQHMDQKQDAQQQLLNKTGSKMASGALPQAIKQQAKKTAHGDPAKTTLELERSQTHLIRQQEARAKRRAECGLDHAGRDAGELVQFKVEQFQRRFGSDAKYYRQPSKEVRNRQQSGHLQFLNYQEIAISQEKLKQFKGKIVQRPIDSSLEKPKLPISDARTNVPRNRNDFFVKADGLPGARTGHERTKENFRSSLPVHASGQLHEQAPSKTNIEENYREDIVVQIPEASLQYQSDRLGSTARVPISQLNKYSLQHDQKMQAKQLRMQQSISRFFVPNKTWKADMLSHSTSSTNVRVNKLTQRVISEGNFREIQAREAQQQSVVDMIQAEQRLQANAFSPKLTKNLTKMSRMMDKNMATARSNRKSTEAKGVTSSMVSGSHNDMLTLANTARGGITQRNNNTDVGSTNSATLYHEPSLKSSTNLGKSMQKINQRYNKLRLEQQNNSPKSYEASQNHHKEQVLRPTPQQEKKQVDSAFARTFINTAIKMKQSNRRHLAKGKYQTAVKSVSQRVRFEKQETQRIVQKHVLQQKLLHRYGIAAKGVQLPAYALMSQSNFNTAAVRQGNNQVAMSASSKPKQATSKRQSGDLNVEEKEEAAVPKNGPQYLNFRDIRDNFGICQSETSKLPTQQSLFGAKKSAANQEVDCVEMLAEEEDKIQQQILCELQNDEDSAPSDGEDKQSSDDEDPEHRAQDSINVKIKFILFDLGQNTYHKDFKDYRFWMKIAQKKFQEAGNDELAIDFLRNGLREIPKNPQLLYNYACANEKIGNYHIAVKFFQFAGKLKQNWADALFGEAVTHFKLRNFSEAESCIEKALKCYRKPGALEEFEVMLYFKAMVYKKLKQFGKAKSDYESLQQVFCQNEGESILHFVVGLILLPLRESRREKFDYLENTLKLIKHFKKVQPKEKNKLLSNYVNKKTGYLDMEKHKAVLIKILRNEPFFKRFDIQTLGEVLGHGRPKQFKSNEILFLNDCVGIITHGSVRIKNHRHDILSPSVEAKYGKGKILGHYSDNGVTTNPQSWVITYDDDTEVLFFETPIFNKLWNIQFQKTDRQIIEANIECNPLLRCLSDQSQYQIIYEDMEIRKFKPGQLICRMSKRSKLNTLFRRLQEQQASRLMEDMEVAKALQHVDGPGGNGAGAAETVISGFVKSLTTHKSHAPRSQVPDLLTPTRSPREAATENDKPTGTIRSAAPHQHVGDDQASQKEQQDEDLLAKCKQHPQYITLVEDLLRDQTYKEVDGVYIVYQGHVDILSQKDNKLLHQINIFENFGESIIVNTPSYEYFGDLYAGLNPRNPQQARTVKDLVAEQIFKRRNELEKEKTQTERGINKKKSSSTVGSEEDIMTLNKQERLIAKLKQMEEQLITSTDDLIDPDDCTICLYIPYERFVSLPASELKRIEEEATLFKLKEGVTKYVAESYEVSEELLKIY